MGVLRVHQLGLHRGLEPVQGGGGAQAGMLVGVLQLQGLHEPFDVRETPATQLHMPGRVGTARQALVLHPSLHASDLIELALGELRRVAVGIDQLGEPLSEQIRPRHGPGSGERLELPGVRPAAVVLGVGLQRPDHGTGAPLGTQIVVDLQHALGHDRRVAGPLEQLDHPLDHPRRLLPRLLRRCILGGVIGGRSLVGGARQRIVGFRGVVGARALHGIGRPGGRGIVRSGDQPELIAARMLVAVFAGDVDVEDIGVGAVADLATALAPHGDHEDVGCPGHSLLAVQLPLGGIQGAEHRSAVDVRQRRDDLLDIDQPGGVGQRHAQRLPAPHQSDHAHCGLGIRVTAHLRVRLRPQCGEGPGLELGVRAQPRGGLRQRLEHVRDVARGGEHVAQALRPGVGIAQHPQVPGRGAQLLRHSPEAEQPGIRIDAFGEPLEQHRKQRAQDASPAADAPSERLEVTMGSLGVAVAQRLEAVSDLVLVQLDALEGGVGDRGQQRAVEDPLVHAAHGPARLVPALHQVVAAGAGTRPGRVHGGGDHGQLRGGGGHQVGATHAEELDAMLEQAQPSVLGAELLGVLTADVPGVGQGRQGVRGGTGAHGLVAAAVHQLQQLDGELDVAQAAGAELDLAVPLLGGDVVHDAPAHGLHRGHEALALARLPHHGRDRLGVAPAELLVPRHGPGLEQRLELPGLGPLAVVAHVGVQCARQRPVLALGAQVGVEFPQRGLRAVGHHGSSGPAGQGRGQHGCAVVVDRQVAVLAAKRVDDVVDVDDVHVRDVVQLPGPALAHPDDAEPDALELLRVRLGGPAAGVDLASGDGQRGLEGRCGQIRELPPDGRQVINGIGGAQIAQGDADELAAVLDAQGCRAVIADGLRDGRVRLRVGAHAAQEARAQLVGGDLLRLGVEGTIEQVQVLRVRLEEAAEGLGAAQQADQRLRLLRVLQTGSGPGLGLDQSHQAAHGGVRGAGLLELPEQGLELHALQLAEAEPAPGRAHVVEPGLDQAPVRELLERLRKGGGSVLFLAHMRALSFFRAGRDWSRVRSG